MSQCRRSIAVAILVGLSSLPTAPVRADELDCKPGVEEKTYARAAYIRPPIDIHQARGELETWTFEQGLSGGGTGSYDPKTRVQTWTILITPEEPGVTLTVHFTTESGEVKVTAQNVCWEKQGDWQPAWKMLNEHLVENGYTPRN